MLAVASLQAMPAAAQTAAGTALPEMEVIASTPLDSSGIALHKFAGNVQTLGADQLATPVSDVTQWLDRSLGSVHTSDTQGNGYGVDVSYRGFTASPALGTPQGLSVFVDGVRVNEPFGDIVSWDAIPQIAISKVTLIPGSNPLYGLNTLGGALALSTKDGNSFKGSQGELRMGSFGNLILSAEHGGHDDNGNLYLAGTVTNDGGWAAHNPSQLRQFFAKYTTYLEGGDAALSVLYADNLLYGNQSVPLSLLDKAAQGYTHPDYAANQSLQLNLQAQVETDSTNAFAGNAYVRDIRKNILNSNLGSVLSTANNATGCASTLNCPGANLLADFHEQILGANLQWRNTGWLSGLNQVLTLGMNAEASNTSFSNAGQYATVDAGQGMVAASPWMSQAEIQSGNRRWAWFATSTFDATDRLSLTASARFDHASLTLSGLSCTDNTLCDLATGSGTTADVSGEHSYQRLNPALGLTYQLNPSTTAFAGYAEGLRTPSAIELACADPAAPCSGVPNAFGADPELEPVVSRTVELGLRGSASGLKWRASWYRSTLDNDILFNQSTLSTGYFSNVGRTLREGLELGVDGSLGRLEYAIDLDQISATYLTGFAVANTANSAAAQDVQPGNRIPGIPQWVLKARLAYALSGQTRLGVSVQAQGPSYARGDDNNADAHGMVQGFTTVKLDVQHQLQQAVSVYAGISNLFDQRYASYGTLAANNLASGQSEQFLSLGAPRSLYAGLVVRWR